MAVTTIMAGTSICNCFADQETEAQKLNNLHKVTLLVRGGPVI